MDLKIEYADSVTVVTYPTASLDTSNVQDFKEAMKEMLQSGGPIILDLSKLIFIDSQGLGVLISCQKYVKDKDYMLTFCNLTGTVNSLFRLVRMHKIFNIYNTREEAIASMRITQ